MGLVAGAVLGGKAVNGAVQNQVGSGDAQSNINPYLQQQTNLATQLQGVANGTGPNPALAQLNQATQANGQQAASLLASQRGMNSGLAARTAAQDQTQANQQAAGQAATLQAQQQLGAMGQLNNIYTAQSGATNNASQIAAGIGQGNQQQTGALVGGVLNGFSGMGAAAAKGGAGGMAQGGVVHRMAFGGQSMQSDGGGYGPDTPDAPYIDVDTGKPTTTTGGYIPPLTGYNKGTYHTVDPVTGQDMTTTGGLIDPNANKNGPKSNAGKHLQGSGSTPNAFNMPMQSTLQPLVQTQNTQVTPIPGALAKGGKVKQVQTILSPGEKTLTPKEAEKVAKGKADPMQVGKTIPGKAKVPGDSLQNDTVPRKLEEGGIVIPRSVMQAKHPAWAAHAFVSAHLGLSKSKKSK